MGKKKRGGGNKKNNAGGRGGGRNPSAGDSTKKQFCGRREMPQPPIKIDDDNGIDEDKAATTKELEDVQGDNFAGGAVRGSDDGDATGDVQLLPPPTELEDGTTEKVIDDGSKVAHVNETSSSGCVAADKIEADVSNNAAATEAASDNKVEAIPTSNEKEDDADKPTAVEDEVDTEIEPADSKDVPLSDINHDPFSDGTDSANASPINDAVKEESADTCSVDGADAVEPSTEVESVEIGTIHVDNDVSSKSEVIVGIKKNTSSINGNETLASVDSFSGDDDIAQATKEIGPYSSQLSLGMEEVDLDAPEKLETPPPLARAFNGTPNGLSPADHSLSFGFQDSIENEAFVFLTASLRENLGGDANGVSDDTLSRYIRWKPDVKRAADRFRAYQKFRKENSYVFDDKPLLLSQDPKLTFLIQNGMVIAPDELVAKDGSGVVILRAAKCDVSAHGCDDQDASRAILYVLQKLVERNTLDPLKGITIVLDLVGVTRRNIPRRLANLLSKAAGCFPLRVQAIYVVAMPWWFPAGHRKLFSIKMRPRIHLLKAKTALFEFIEKDRLLEEDGGIYNFDLKTWISSTVLDEVEQLG